VCARARLQFKVSQERELVPRSEVVGLLETALQGHLNCLRLDPENEDALLSVTATNCLGFLMTDKKI
jgi:hypothetical protein